MECAGASRKLTCRSVVNKTQPLNILYKNYVRNI
jgi:hypothetical protein